jgi:hypothetical protein
VASIFQVSTSNSLFLHHLSCHHDHDATADNDIDEAFAAAAAAAASGV